MDDALHLIDTLSKMIQIVVGPLVLAFIAWLKFSMDRSSKAAAKEVRDLKAAQAAQAERVARTIEKTTKEVSQEFGAVRGDLKAVKLTQAQHTDLMRRAVAGSDGAQRVLLEEIVELRDYEADRFPDDVRIQEKASHARKKLDDHNREQEAIPGMSSDSLQALVDRVEDVEGAPAPGAAAQKVADLSVAKDKAVADYDKEQKAGDS